MGRKENRTSKRVQILGLHIQRKVHIREIMKVVECVGSRREKVGR
jgi:hypothetical protein